MKENSSLCGILETMKNHFHLKCLDLSLLSTPRNNDEVTETYLSCLEEILSDIDISFKRFNNQTKEESNALYNLRNDPTIIIKNTDKGRAVVVWEREDYLKEVEMKTKICIKNSKINLAPLLAPL